jgi:2'-deoxynucleoside 5'-phosphate N-hydrolase
MGAEVDSIAVALDRQGITPLIFVDKYTFPKGDERRMMNQSFHDIKSSTILIAEVTDKHAIGVGIEIGYAAALGKPMLYLRRRSAEYSTTVGGVIQNMIIYESPTDLELQLEKMLSGMDLNALSET